MITPSLLIIRPDAIGDVVLFSAALPSLRKKYQNHRIVLIVQTHIVPLVEGMPFIDDVIGLDRDRFYCDREYSTAIINRVRGLKVKVALYPAYSREPLGDFLVLYSGAEERIVQAGDCANMPEEMRQRHHPQFTSVFEVPAGFCQEIDRNRSFIELLTKTKISQKTFIPMLFLKEEKIPSFNLPPGGYSAIAPFAQNSIRHWAFEKWVEVLSSWQENPLVLLGDGQHRAEAESMKQGLLKRGNTNVENFCGKLSLRQAAMVIKNARNLLGVENGLVQIATAFGVPSVVITGGGHFGRFVPTSSLQHAVVNAMPCFGCNWQCCHETALCIQDIKTESVLAALECPENNPLPEGLSRPEVFFYSTDKQGYYHMGSWVQGLQEYESAQWYFERAVAENASDKLRGGAWFHLGEIHLALNREESAKDALRRCLDYVPSHEKAKVLLTQLSVHS